MSSFPWRTLLFVSLAVNLLVIGAVAGAYGAGVRLQRQNAEAVVERMPGPRAFLAALPPETRAKLRPHLVESWTQTRDARATALQARRDAFAAAAAEPYDAPRVRAAFARLREADQAAIGVFQDNVVEAFATLTPEERAAALDALRTAAPARRDMIAPRAERLREEGVNGDGATTPRERLRERWRERRQARRERLQQQQPPQPAP